MRDEIERDETTKQEEREMRESIYMYYMYIAT